MLRPDKALHKAQNSEIIQDCKILLDYDFEQLEKQSSYFRRCELEGLKNEKELTKWRERIEHLQTRTEFFRELLSRVESFYSLNLLLAVEIAENEAKKRGTPNTFGLHLYFNPNQVPEILII